MRFAQLVTGPAGSGKSTYCSNLVKHAEDCKRTVRVINLDPAADNFEYEAMADIRELINLEDAMEDEDLRYGPNGGLIFCMEYLIEHSEWLQEQIGGGDDDDDYILFDFPGQIELYTHMNVTGKLIKLLESWNFRVCAVFLLDSSFMVETNKYFAGVLTALSVMMNLEIAQVNVLSKMDLLSKQSKNKIDRFLDADADLLDEEDAESFKWSKKYAKLSQKIGKVINDYSLVRFCPLDISDDDSFTELLEVIDNSMQYGEDGEVKMRDFEEGEPDEAFYDG